MIRVNRASVKAPDILNSPRANTALAKAKQFFGRPLPSRRQERFVFDPRIYRHVEVRQALHKLFHGKCAYCETTLWDGSGIQVDQFRPKAGAVGLAREYSPDHYWWLSYKWFNLYLVCGACNNYKGPKFPVEGSRAQVLAGRYALDKQEQRLLLDPCSDNPTDHLAFDSYGRLKGLTKRGQMTIEVFNLNRDALVAARKELATKTLFPAMRVLDRVRREQAGLVLYQPEEYGLPAALKSLISQVIAGVKDKIPSEVFDPKALFDRLVEAVLPQSQFSGMSQQLVQRWLGENKFYSQTFLPRKGTAGAVAAKALSKHQAPKVTIATRRIESIHIHNFKAISDLRLKCPTGTRSAAPWVMILGENATGKSSILQAVALALMGEARRVKLGVTPASILRRTAQSGYVKLRLSGHPGDVTLLFSAGSRQFVSEPAEPNVLLLGYGATRLLPRARAHAPRSSGHVRVGNLFDPFVALIDAKAWLRRLPKPSFDYTARAIKDVLSLARRARIIPSRDGAEGILVNMFGKNVPLDALSDGYQSVIGLTADLIKGLRAEHKGGLEAAEGIVLLDEMGAHLHPRWRMRIVSSLREAFPRVQFIATTHDPLCLRGLSDGEVVVLRRSDRGRVFDVEDLPPVQGLRVDQLLTSEYFGLHSTMDPETEADFNEYYRLLALRMLNSSEQRRLIVLRNKLADIALPGTTRRERLMLREIDKYLARTEHEPDPTARAKAKTAQAKALNRLTGPRAATRTRARTSARAKSKTAKTKNFERNISITTKTKMAIRKQARTGAWGRKGQG